MKLMAIETSCDETGISVLSIEDGLEVPKFKVLANELASQAKLHAEYGGVYPNLAKREHQKSLPILYKKALLKAKIEPRELDVICVTNGPGLEPALWTGVVFATELAKELGKPLVPVNHMEGHILAAFGRNEGEFEIPKIDFPVVSLLVSGGHTELVFSEEWRRYEIIGETLDDAAGEAFDKVARMLDLPYPGGPEIECLAEKHKSIVMKRLGSSTERARGIFQQKNIRALQNNTFVLDSPISLPRPMLHSKDFNFSFSGLKTATLYLIRDLKEKESEILNNSEIVSAIAKEFQDSVTEVLVGKTKRAIEQYNARTLIVGGGVANNKHIQEELKNSITDTEILFPGKGLSTDNSIMIGIAGFFKYHANPESFSPENEIRAEGNLRLG